MEILAERIKELRLEKNLSIAQLSKETGLSKSAISYWERAIKIPSAEAVAILAKFFDISADYLLGLED